MIPSRSFEVAKKRAVQGLEVKSISSTPLNTVPTYFPFVSHGSTVFQLPSKLSLSMISFPAPLDVFLGENGLWIDVFLGGAAVTSKISFGNSAGEDAISRKQSGLISLPRRLPMLPTASIGEDGIDIGFARVLDGDDGDEGIRRRSVGEGGVESRGPNIAALGATALPVDGELSVGSDDFGSDSDSAVESALCPFISLLTDFSAEP